jgi:hypothetical protein
VKVIKSQPAKEKFVPFSLYSERDKHIDYLKKNLWNKTFSLDKSEKEPIHFIKHEYQRSNLNWTILIGLICIFILLGLKSYYQKFVTKVVNTLVNFQLADTMYREKNIIVRRAFFMMNTIYVLVFSLFILQVMMHFGFKVKLSLFHQYLIILLVVIALLFLRLILFYLTAFIFDWIPAISQHIHSTFLINKNLGIFLLPVVFMVIYTKPTLSQIILYLGLGMVILATLFKLFRGFKIIIRKDVLLFYAILYLCTLELLPIVLGSKFIIMLR